MYLLFSGQQMPLDFSLFMSSPMFPIEGKEGFFYWRPLEEHRFWWDFFFRASCWDILVRCTVWELYPQKRQPQRLWSLKRDYLHVCETFGQVQEEPESERRCREVVGCGNVGEHGCLHCNLEGSWLSNCCHTHCPWHSTRLKLWPCFWFFFAVIWSNFFCCSGVLWSRLPKILFFTVLDFPVTSIYIW